MQVSTCYTTATAATLTHRLSNELERHSSETRHTHLLKVGHKGFELAAAGNTSSQQGQHLSSVIVVSFDGRKHMGGGEGGELKGSAKYRERMHR